MPKKSLAVPWYCSLRFRLVTAAITIEVFMLSVLLVNSFQLLDAAVKSQTQTRLEALSTLLDAALAGRVFQRDYTELETIIKQLTTSKRTEIVYIAVFDSSGTLLARAGDFTPANQPEEDHTISTALTDLIYDTRLPLTIIDTTLGSVHFGISLASMVTTQNKVIKEGIFIAAIEILLSLLLLISVGYLITRHLRLLTEGTRRIAGGNYSAQLVIPGRDEISLLAEDFNSMTVAVSAHVSELKSSEMRFHTIFNAVGEAIFIHDITTGAILDVNQRMCEMFECTYAEAISTEVSTLCAGIPPYTTEEAFARIGSAVNGIPQVFDWHARTCKGKLFWVEISLRLATINNHNRLIAVVRDISKRKIAEEEMNRAIARFQTLVNSLDALVCVIDMDTHELLFINKYGQKMHKHLANGHFCWQILQAGQNGPCPFCNNTKLIDIHGRPTDPLIRESRDCISGDWFECRDQAIPWTDGRLVRMEIAFNITARKTAEEALATEKEQLNVTLRSIADGVITTDIDGRIVLINKAAEELTGWSQQEALGRPLPEVFVILNDKTRQPCENPVEKVLATGEVIGLANHTSLVARNGRERRIADSGAPILDREGNALGVVLVFQDISEKQRVEEEMLKVEKLESVGVLAGGIAHDFNNILTAILGNISMALLDDNLEEKTRRRLTEAEKASFRAKDLTRQLLTFSKGGDPVKETASIGEIIRDSADFVLHGSNVSCRYAIAEDLWLVDIDCGQISQVIQNLIINARDAMPDGGIIEVVCKNIAPEIPEADNTLPAPEKSIRITISDSGSGIPPDLIDKIFDPYFTTKKKGSGLGLAISYAIIHKHAGSISVQSIQGKGTSFTLELPASKEQQLPEKNKTSMNAILPEARIMLMDDEEMVREITSALLTMLGHEVIEAKDGEEAVALYKKESEAGRQIDLFIMDLTIPGGMGGKEAAHEILTLNPAAKIVVASGYSNDPVMAQCREHGFSAAIMKPFQLHEMIEVLNKVLT